jgi:O-acetyl-ADP-ribose deacetylase (regulator of RNase III)
MIHVSAENLLDSNAEALVNAVNSVGVMGKGIALQFKHAFPDNYAAYAAACKRGEVQPGKMFVFHTNMQHNPSLIITFSTQRHWRGKSRLKDIESGLNALIEVVREEKIRSIAVPPLGCGNGGLDWDEVRPRIERAFSAVPDVEVRLVRRSKFGPSGKQMGSQLVQDSKHLLRICTQREVRLRKPVLDPPNL